MDNLSRDSTRAIAAGMSYGQWKALHPFTKHLLEPEQPNGKYIKQCPTCSIMFGTNKSRKRFCTEDCKIKYYNSRTLRKYMDGGDGDGK